jgi:hypothetical protein
MLNASIGVDLLLLSRWEREIKGEGEGGEKGSERERK